MQPALCVIGADDLRCLRQNREKAVEGVEMNVVEGCAEKLLRKLKIEGIPIGKDGAQHGGGIDRFGILPHIFLQCCCIQKPLQHLLRHLHLVPLAGRLRTKGMELLQDAIVANPVCIGIKSVVGNAASSTSDDISHRKRD